MLTQNNHNSAVASELIEMSLQNFPIDKKTRERLVAARRMAARRAIERHYEARELARLNQEYWFDE